MRSLSTGGTSSRGTSPFLLQFCSFLVISFTTRHIGKFDLEWKKAGADLNRQRLTEMDFSDRLVKLDEEGGGKRGRS